MEKALHVPINDGRVEIGRELAKLERGTRNIEILALLLRCDRLRITKVFCILFVNYKKHGLTCMSSREML